MGCDPFLVVRARGKEITIENSEEPIIFSGNPFDVLQEVLDLLNVPPLDSELPFYAGGMGYWGYDLRYHLEKLPDLSEQDIPMPDLYMLFPCIILVHDRNQEKYHLIGIEHELPRQKNQGIEQKMRNFIRKISKWGSHIESAQEPMCTDNYHINFTREDYVSAIERTREYIRQGDIYQVNISQRFIFPFQGSDYLLFLKLFERNPASFYAFLNCGDFNVLSTSPERFIYREKNYVETRPIKGTKPRGKNSQEDEQMRRELIESTKEEAELSMIVDLLRNDIGKVCVPGTVKVREHKRVEEYENVFHLVSIVEGQLEDGCSHMELLKAVFPGGSITGCPKIRSMEIIEELETVKRGIYTGAIGYVSFHDTMDLSIVIRTAVHYKDNLYLSVGGGIVYRSEPESEYMETIHKGETFLKVLNQSILSQ